MPDESVHANNADDGDNKHDGVDKDDGCGADDGMDCMFLDVEAEHLQNLNLQDGGEKDNTNNRLVENLELPGSDDSVDLLVPPDEIDQSDQDGQDMARASSHSEDCPRATPGVGQRNGHCSRHPGQESSRR